MSESPLDDSLPPREVKERAAGTRADKIVPLLLVTGSKWSYGNSGL